MKTSIFILFTVFALVFSSCRSVKKGVADEVINVFVYEKDGKVYLISRESLFQTTSKSTSGGMTTTSGWYDTRISVYDIETGELVNRKEFGEITDDENEQILACTEDRLWLYSVDEDKGLYAVDPLTLEEVIRQEEILGANPSLKGRLAQPEYYEIIRFYGYDELMGKLILTDDQAIRYTLDPKSLKAEKQAEEIRIPSYGFDDWFGNFHHVKKNSSDFDTYEDYRVYEKSLINIRLDGDNRKLIKMNDSIVNKDLSFLEGKFILEREFGSQDNAKFLQPKENTYLIAHRSSTNNNAVLIITCVYMNTPGSSGDISSDKTNITVKWETTFDNLFFDYGDADDTDEFEDVYSKGDPEFDFNFFRVIDNKLLMIYGLYAVSIDAENGNILWKTRL